MLEGKKILVMGIRNNMSIAWHTAKVLADNGAKVIFSYSAYDDVEKINKLIEEIPNSKAYLCDVSKDESIVNCMKNIKEEFGQIDGIFHSIAHAHSGDLKNDFIKTTREGFFHANDVSAYSILAVSKIALEENILKENSSIVTLTYYGAEKIVEGYNVMGIAKAALEKSIMYLAKDLGKYNIRINAISSGTIKTSSSGGINNFDRIMKINEGKSLLIRKLTAKDIGNTACFLFSNMSEAITGEIIHVDNGVSIVGI